MGATCQVVIICDARREESTDNLPTHLNVLTVQGMDIIAAVPGQAHRVASPMTAVPCNDGPVNYHEETLNYEDPASGEGAVADVDGDRNAPGSGASRRHGVGWVPLGPLCCRHKGVGQLVPLDRA